MKHIGRLWGIGLAAGVIWLGCVAGRAAERPVAASTNAVTREQVRAAISRGLKYLERAQNSNGWWSTPDQPAVTALVLTAFNLEPSRDAKTARSSELNRAYDYILSSAKPDGSIQRMGLANYNTALSLVALTSAGDPSFLPVIKAGRSYIAKTQIDMGAKGTNDTPFDGGVGYGSKYLHSDMNNTLIAIEAMRLSEKALPPEHESRPAEYPDLNWQAVSEFLQNCQNLPDHNSADWVSGDPKDRGGFVYYPGFSNAGGTTNKQTGRVSLRSYGSVGYGGLLSYIYAKVDRKDPRVTGVADWLRSNYTLDENPAMGNQGYYYYLYLMTKGLTVWGEDPFRLADGRKVHWRDDVASVLMKLQQPEGFWRNQEPRWWESDSVLVTAYSVMTLEMIQRGLPQ